MRFSTRRSGIHDARAGKNGVPPPTAVGAITIRYSSTSPARTIGAASVAPATSRLPSVSAFSVRTTSTGSPRSRREFQSTESSVRENTTLGMSRQMRAKSVITGVASATWSAVGQYADISS